MKRSSDKPAGGEGTFWRVPLVTGQIQMRCGADGARAEAVLGEAVLGGDGAWGRTAPGGGRRPGGDGARGETAPGGGRRLGEDGARGETAPGGETAPEGRQRPREAWLIQTVPGSDDAWDRAWARTVHEANIGRAR
ncbi:hypothetical protein JCM9957A_31080 [Kineosporia succinea]